MTAPRDVDRLLRTYLDTGPTQLPDRSFDAVREAIDDTRQRVVIGPWRNPMPAFARFAAAAAAVAIVAVVGLSLLPAAGGIGSGPAPTATPKPTPTATPIPAALPLAGDLAPGTYTMPASVYGGPAFTMAVPAGWSVDESSFVLKNTPKAPLAATDGLSFSPWLVDRVFTDGCDQANAPAIGPTADDLITALMALTSRTPDGPTTTTVAGLPATRVRLSVPADSPCGAVVRNWPDPGNTDLSGGWPSVPGQVDDVYIVDAGFSRPVVLVAAHGADASGADLAELQAMLDSVRFANR